ncbi:fibronectin type III domain-containing protein [Populibacterium corticicola]|uniref:Fibronectin type III domain-containing protein n=1 Tax=Populibacterium corticicola TaxID=1812826 RepID=A0ABW5XCM4_9MICO
MTGYTWRVGAIYPGSSTPVWSDDEFFDRGALQPAGEDYTPSGTVTYPSKDVSFSWPQVPGASGYKFEYSTNESFAGAITRYTTSTTLSPDFPISRLKLLGGQEEHFWRVTPLDGATSAAKAVGKTSDNNRFVLVWADSTPDLTFPGPQTETWPELNDVRFTWTKVKGAKYYEVKLSGEEGAGFVHTAKVPTTSYTPKRQLTRASYHWQVTAYDANGQPGVPSEVRQFRRSWGGNVGEAFDGTTPNPQLRKTSTGIDWTTQGTESSNPVEISLTDLEFAWHPVARAAYYELEVSAARENGRFSFDKKKTCITPNTDATPMRATARDVASTGVNYQTLNANCLVATNTPSHADNLQVGETYAWFVRAFDTNAQGKLIPSYGDESIEFTGYSALRYFTILPAETSTKPAPVLRVMDVGGVSIDDSQVGSATPLLLWDPLPGDWPITRVRIRQGTQTEGGWVVTSYVYGATTARLNGILSNYTTTQGYNWSVTGCLWEKGNEPSCDVNPAGEYDSQVYGVDKHKSFQKEAPKVQFTSGHTASEVSTDQFHVSWEPYQADSLKYGGSAGYSVRIIDTTSQPNTTVLSERVEGNSWQYAEGDVEKKTPLNLAYGRNYTLSAAPLDARGEVGTYNEGFEFQLKPPSASEFKGEVDPTASGVTFTWSDSDTSVKYGVEYAPVGSSTWTKIGYVSNKPALTQRNVTIPRPKDGEYQWRIQSLDRNGATTTVSTQDNFTVSGQAFKPTLTTANNTVLKPNARVLKWNRVAGASSYQVSLNTSTTFASANKVTTVQNQFVPVGTTATYAASRDFAFKNGTYYWQVEALNEAGAVIGVSDVRTFTVENEPTTPSIGSLTVNGTAITVNWKALTGGDRGSNGNVTYSVQHRKVTFPETPWPTSAITTARDAASYTVNGLARGTEYEFRIRANNPVGSSVWSATKKTTTIDVPAVPRSPKATATTDTVTLSWSAPSGTNKATSYKVRYRPSTTTSWTTMTSTSTSLKLAGLKNGTTYYYEIIAVNAVGDGPAAAGSVKTATPPKAPSTPTNFTAKAATGKATLSWKAPAAGTAKITRYTIQSRQYDAKKKKWSAWKSAGTATSTKFTAGKLTNGTKYEFRVAATSSVGTGSYTAAKSVTPVGKPTAPKVTVSSKKKKQITVNWSGAKANGSKITSYRVQVSTNGKKWTTVKKAKASAKSFTWKKAKAGTKYQVRVVTYNKKGNVASAKKTVTVKR